MEEGIQFPKVQTKSSKKRKKIKKEVIYQRLPKSIKKSLKSNIHWTMMSVLHEVTEDYNENEKHLNILKERFLKFIETVEVPVDELNCLTSVQKILKEEEKKYILMEEEWEYLEGEITKDILPLNTMDEETQTLQKKIKALKRELRTLEADTFFKIDFKDDLRLPGLPMEYFKRPPLQNEVLKIGNPQALLDDMNIIQQSDEMKNMMAFLEQLYEKADCQVKSDDRYITFCTRLLLNGQVKMLVLNCSTKLQTLEQMLRKNFPESLKVYGAVLNINRGNPFKKEVVVDSWPEFKAVITRRQKEAKSDALDYFTNACAVFYKNLQAYQALLENPETINWEQVFQIQGLQDGLYNISKIVADAKHVNVKLSSFKMVIYPDPDALPDVQLPLVPALKVTSLDVSHASLLNNTWSRGGSDQCQRYLINLICCFPSICILDEHRCPISWGLTDQFATMIHGYTLPEHRRKGYNRLIATNLAKMLHSKGFPVQGNVLEDNLPSLTLLKSMNAIFLPCQFVRLIHTPFCLLAKPE